MVKYVVIPGDMTHFSEIVCVLVFVVSEFEEMILWSNVTNLFEYFYVHTVHVE
jgi:hypothetical protein